MFFHTTQLPGRILIKNDVFIIFLFNEDMKIAVFGTIPFSDLIKEGFKKLGHEVSNNNPDLYYWEVFKDGELLLQTSESSFEDTSINNGGIVTYTIRGVDIHENIGDFSEPFEVVYGQLGDVTWDGTIDILDILNLADIIINGGNGFDDATLWAAELNSDGVIDVFDLLQLVDYIMSGGSLNRNLLASGETSIYHQGDNIFLSTSVPVHGIELTLSSPVESISNLTDFTFSHQNEKVLMYSIKEGHLLGNKVHLFEIPDGVSIESAKVAGPGGVKYSTNVAVVPETFAVHQNYPNPFNPSTNIQIELPEVTQLCVTIYNAMGREVVVLVNKEYSPGFHQLRWNGINTQGIQVASGIYFIRVITPDRSKIIKSMLIR